MVLIKKTSLPADALYKLAFNPVLELSEKIKESIDDHGWLKKYPAKLYLQTGTHPKVDGCHRLSYLASISKLNTLIPCQIFLL